MAASISPNTGGSGGPSDTNIVLKKKSGMISASQESLETAQDKLDKCLEIFFTRILANLHVVVMASLPSTEGEIAANFFLYTALSSSIHFGIFCT